MKKVRIDQSLFAVEHYIKGNLNERMKKKMNKFQDHSPILNGKDKQKFLNSQIVKQLPD